MTADTPPHLIVFADSADVPLLSAAFERLPRDAFGAVFIEAARGSDIISLPAPAGLSVTWLLSEAAPVGTRLLTAARAWIAEWQVPGQPLAQYHLWIGCSNEHVAEQLHREMHVGCHHGHD